MTTQCWLPGLFVSLSTQRKLPLDGQKLKEEKLEEKRNGGREKGKQRGREEENEREEEK